MALTASQIASRLFKKSLNAGETLVTRQFFEEPRLGGPFIFSEQIWSESGSIPSQAPVLASGASSGVVQYFEKELLTHVSGSSNLAYYSANLMDSIPFNYGTSGTYNYQVYKNDGSTSIAFGEGDWLIDNSAGLLTFYGTLPSGVSSAAPPRISFYKYIGSKGVSAISGTGGGSGTSGSSGTSGTSGTSVIGATGISGSSGTSGSSGLSPNQNLEQTLSVGNSVGTYSILFPSIPNSVLATDANGLIVATAISGVVGSSGTSGTSGGGTGSGGPQYGSFALTLDGQGGVVSTGQKGYLQIQYDGQITGYSIIADPIGSVSFDVWIRSGALPTVSNSIVGNNYPELTNGVTFSTTTLTGWQTSFTASQFLGWNVRSSSGATYVRLELTTLKS